jgi:16S rRNA (guanine1516-N2)-methyltransferase
VTYAIAIQQFLSANLSKGRSRSGRSSPSPFFVDFCPPLASRQGKRIGGQSGKDLLLKAVGPFKGGKGLKICDLTAGFGQDSIILAKGGASSVLMVERDPVVALLLQDALRRLSLLADTGDPTAIELNNKLSLEMGDGIEVARRLMGLPSKEVPEIFYLDPMFPPRAKSAAVKKDMQILHSLLDSQGSSDVYNDTEMALSEAKLLDAAFDAARLRVVVKRPINAELLGGLDHSRRPTYDIRGSSYRWDVYVKQ